MRSAAHPARERTGVGCRWSVKLGCWRSRAETHSCSLSLPPGVRACKGRAKQYQWKQSTKKGRAHYEWVPVGACTCKGPEEKRTRDHAPECAWEACDCSSFEAGGKRFVDGLRTWDAAAHWNTGLTARENTREKEFRRGVFRATEAELFRRVKAARARLDDLAAEYAVAVTLTDQESRAGMKRWIAQDRKIAKAEHAEAWAAYKVALHTARDEEKEVSYFRALEPQHRKSSGGHSALHVHKLQVMPREVRAHG